VVVRCQIILVAVALLCGCSLLDAAGSDTGDGDTSGGGDAGGQEPGDASPPCQVVDDFEDGVIGDPWVSWADDDATVSESNGAMHVSFSGATEAWAGYDLRDRIDFTEAEVRVEIQAAGGSYTGFDVCFGDQELELWIEDGDQLVGEVYNTEASDDSTAVTYDPVAHRILRIRASQGMAYWEASPDGDEWESIHTQAVPFPIDDVTVTVEAAGEEGDPPASFEWFAATPTGCAQ
jgi:hypothetical protein